MNNVGNTGDITKCWPEHLWKAFPSPYDYIDRYYGQYMEMVWALHEHE